MENETVDLNLVAEPKKKVQKKKVQEHIESKSLETPKIEGIGDSGYTLDLPSDGKIYGKTVKIKAMTAKEEDILSNPQYLKKKVVFDELLKSIMIDSPVDPKEFLIGDRDFIIFNARIDAYGSDYEAKLACPQCGTVNEVSFDIANMDIKELEISPYIENENLFEYTTSTGRHVLFHFWTVELQNRFSSYVEQTKKMKTTGLVTTRLFFQIHSIDGEEERSELRQIIENMKASESLEIRKYINKNTPSIDLTMHDFECENVDCGFDKEVDLPLGENFFWPDLR
jgi:hypothetical protein